MPFGLPRRRGLARRLVVLLVLIACLVGAASGFWIYRKDKIRQNYARLRTQGLSEAGVGNWVSAVQHLSIYLQRNPNDIDAWAAYVQARPQVVEDSHREIADTIHGLRALLRLDPDRPDAQRQLLRLYMNARYFAEAADVANSLLLRTPDDIEMVQAKSVALIRLGQYKDALETTRHWNDLAPQDLDAEISLLSLMRENNLAGEQIVMAASTRLKARPNDSRLQLAQAYAYLANNEGDAARKILQDVLTKPLPDDEKFTKLLMSELDGLSMHEESLALLRKLVSRRGDPENYRELVDRLWELSRPQEALDVFNGPGAAVVGTDSELLAIRSLCLAQLQRTAEVEPIRRMLKTLADEKDPVAAAWLIVLDEVVGHGAIDVHNLFDACQLALEHNPNDDYLREFLGEAYSRLGENDLAIGVWTKVAQDNPTWCVPLVRLADVMVDTGRFDSAIAMADEAVRRSPQSLAVAVTMARVELACMEIGRFDRTKDLLSLVDQIQASDPGEEETMAIRVAALAWQHKTEDADKALDEELALPKTISEPLLLRLAAISRAYKLDREDACFARSQKEFGTTPALAYAKAVDRFANGQTKGGLATFNAARARVDPDAKSFEWQLQLARYLDLTGDPEAPAVVQTLGDDNPKDLHVQQMVLNCQSARQDKELMRRTIGRIHDLTGDEGTAWQLAQARWLLDFSANDDQRAAQSAAGLLNSLVHVAPDSTEVRLQLARSYERLDRLPDAIDQATMAADLSPGAHRSRSTLPGSCRCTATLIRLANRYNAWLNPIYLATNSGDKRRGYWRNRANRGRRSRFLKRQPDHGIHRKWPT